MVVVVLVVSVVLMVLVMTLLYLDPFESWPYCMT
jgi:hypothetical protein